MENVTVLGEPEFPSKKGKSKAGALRLIIGCLLSAICLYFVFRNVKFAEVEHALATFRWPFLPLGVLSLAVGYIARIYRWKMLLERSASHITTKACTAPFLASIALNNVLPFRLGDIVRALIFPAALGVTKTAATATMVLERLVDLLTLLICLAIAASFFPKGALPAAIIDIVMVLATVGSITMLALIFFTSPIVRLIRWAAAKLQGQAPARLVQIVNAFGDLGEALAIICTPRTVTVALTISFVAWTGELGLYLSLIQGIEMPFSLSGGLLLMSMATIATLVPSSPGYVGPYHLAAFTAANLMGGTQTQAMTLAVLCHLGVWLPTTIAGAAVMIFNRNLFKAVRAQAALDEAGE